MRSTTERYLPELVTVALLGAAGAVSLTIFRFFGILTWAYALTWGLATLGSVLYLPAVRRSGVPWERQRNQLLLVALGLAVVSVATGIGNNATDEPFAMGPFLSTLLSGHDPYTTPVTVTYTARTLDLWSLHLASHDHYVYLPLLLFLQPVGTGALGYKAMCVACWGGIAYLVRKDRIAAILLASPIVALASANGFTDLPVLLLVTTALRGPGGTVGEVARYASYGVKQFANAFWLVYYLLRKEWLKAVLLLAVSAAFVAPFVLWHPYGVWCEAIAFSATPGCPASLNAARQPSDLYAHWNYYVWILWLIALFPDPLVRLGRAGLSRFRRGTSPPTPLP